MVCTYIIYNIMVCTYIIYYIMVCTYNILYYGMYIIFMKVLPKGYRPKCDILPKSQASWFI